MSHATIRPSLINPANLPLGASLLLVRREDMKALVTTRRTSELTCLPGGKRDAGESALENAVRETFEETGVRVDLAACSELISGVCEGDPASPDSRDYWIDCFWAYYEPEFGEPRSLEANIRPLWVTLEEMVSGSAFPIYNQRLADALGPTLGLPESYA